MSDALKRLDEAFAKVAELEGDLDAYLADGNEADLVMKSGGEATIRDGIMALRNLVVRLAGALTEKSVKTEAEKAIAKALEEKLPAAAQLQLPKGSIVVHDANGRPEELTTIVLRGCDTELLTKVIKATARHLAGGDDRVLEIAGETFPAKTLDHWSNRAYAWEGAPQLGSVVVRSADESGLLTKSTGPTEPEGELTGLGDYLLASARKGANRQVRLVGEGDPRATRDAGDRRESDEG